MMNDTELRENIEQLYNRYITVKPYDRIDGEDITVGRTMSTINELSYDDKEYYENIIHELANVPAETTPEDLDGKVSGLWDKTVKTLLTSNVDNLIDNMSKVSGDQLDSYIWLFNNFSNISEKMSFRIPLILQMHESGYDNDLQLINQYYIDAAEANNDDNNLIKKPSTVAAWEASPDADVYGVLRDIMSSDNDVIIQMIANSGADNPNWRYNTELKDRVQHTIALTRWLAESIKTAKDKPTANDIQNAIEYIKNDVNDHGRGQAGYWIDEDDDMDDNTYNSGPYPSEKTVARLRDGFVNGTVVKMILDFSNAANNLDSDYKEALEKDLGINLIKEVIDKTLEYCSNGYPSEFVAELLKQQIDEKEELLGEE